MKVTAERSGHAPCAATISSAPSPFWIVITVAPASVPLRPAASGSRSVPLQARIASSASPGSAAGSAVASSRAVKSPRPETRSPCSRSAAACSSRRVSTVTSATCARWAARREPIEPAPATTTRVTAPSLTFGQLGLAQSDHVESRHGPAEALERELAYGDGFDRVVDLGVEPLRDQHLPARGFVRQPRGKVRHAADRGVVGAALETNPPARRVAESDTRPEVELIATLAPQLDQADHLLAQRAAEPHRPQRRVGDLDRIVEEELDAVAFEEADGRLEALHEPADRVVELAQHPQQLLRLDPVHEARPTAQVGEEDRHLPAVTAENRLVARGHDRFRDLGRQEAAELPHPLELLDLSLDPLLQRLVQRLDRVVVALDAQKRSHAREQLVVVERLLDEVVGPRLDRPRLVLADARCDHDHGQHRRGLVLA